MSGRGQSNFADRAVKVRISITNVLFDGCGIRPLTAPGAMHDRRKALGLNIRTAAKAGYPGKTVRGVDQIQDLGK